MACYIFQSCFNCRADENFPCSIANAFNRGWEQFLLQSAHGFQHPTQLQRVPPSPFCPCLMWEGCFVTGLGMVKGWWEKYQQLLEKIRDAPTSLLAALSVSNCKAMGPEQLPPAQGTLWAQRLLEKRTWTHFTPSTLQHHGQPSPLFSLRQLWLTHGQTPHLCVPLWRIKGNYQFLLPFKANISLLSLTASDNEGQFKNHIKIQQSHAHTHSAISFQHFHLCKQRDEERGRHHTGYGIFLFLARRGGLFTPSCDLPQACHLSELHKVATIIVLLSTVKFWLCCSDAVTVHYGRSPEIPCPGPARAGSIANLIRGDISYSNTDSPGTSHTFLHE